VRVNNLTVTELGSQVTPGQDLVAVDGKPVLADEAPRYYLLYKPPGVVTTLSDPQGRSTVKDLLREIPGRVFPVGRLDYDAEGALLLTNDGDLAHRLTHPRFQVERIYLAKVKGDPQEEALERLRKGVRLEDGPAQPKSVTVFERADRNTWLKLVVREGRPHLIKRMCAAIGHPVVRLFRPSHAGLGLEGLRPGRWRPLTSREVEWVKRVANGEPAPEQPIRLPARRHGRSDSAHSDPVPPARSARKKTRADALGRR
jgi:23S rRNA pseudouridine2605 synthase